MPFTSDIKTVAVKIITAIVLLSAGTSAQTLPDNISAKMFYNTNDVTFKDNVDGQDIRTIGMKEVPGYPQHFFVLDQRGRIFSLYPNIEREYAAGEIKEYRKEIILDIRDQVHAQLHNEYGLWGLTFHKNFAENKKFYIIYITENDVWPNPGPYSSQETGGDVIVDEYISNGPYDFNTAETDLEFSRLIFEMYHDTAFGVSNLEFNNTDGYLYITNSDYRAHGYDLTTYARKILRIDVDNPDPGMAYGIPTDNPFYNDPDDNVKKEIWAYGFRNVWQMYIDQVTGDIWAGDVGQWAIEELNYIVKGGNYGWNDGGDTYDAYKNVLPESERVGGLGTGFSGDCDNYNAGTSVNPKPADCSIFEPPYALHPHGSGGDGPMSCILAGTTFRGKESSPFYGWHIYSDTHRGTLYAAKVGEEPQFVGESPSSASNNGDGHAGMVDINSDYFGNMYATYLSWGSETYELWMLDHAQLTPRDTWGCLDSTRVNYDPTAELHDPALCGGLSVESIKNITPQTPPLFVANIQGLTEVEIPKWAVGIDLYNLKGKLLWSYQGQRNPEAFKVTIPRHVSKGVIKVVAKY